MGKLGEHVAQRNIYNVQKTANESDQYSLRYTAGSDGTRQHITSHPAVLPARVNNNKVNKPARKRDQRSHYSSWHWHASIDLDEEGGVVN